MKAAVFYDLENCIDPGLGLGAIHLRITEALSEATLAVQRAYANFAKGYANHVEDMHRYGITPVQVFGIKPNAADFELALDALRLMLEQPVFQIAVIVSNDGDFLPLIRHLRELHVEVVCVLTKKDAHEMLRSNADRVIDLSQARQAVEVANVGPVKAVRLKAEPAKNKTLAAPPASTSKPLTWPVFRKLNPGPPPNLLAFENALRKYLESLCKQPHFSALIAEGLPIASLGVVIKKANPAFSAPAYGFASFSSLLQNSLQTTDWALFRLSLKGGPLKLFRYGQVPEAYRAYSPVSTAPLTLMAPVPDSEPDYSSTSQATGSPSSHALL